MANNKFHDNRGIGTADQESIKRQGVRPEARPAEPEGAVRQVPRSATKPGRSADTSRRAEGERVESEQERHANLGDTYEVTNEDGSVTHKNE